MSEVDQEQAKPVVSLTQIKRFPSNTKGRGELKKMKKIMKMKGKKWRTKKICVIDIILELKIELDTKKS